MRKILVLLKNFFLVATFIQETKNKLTHLAPVRRYIGFGIVLILFSLSSALLAGDDSGINLKTLTKLAKDKDKAVAYTATAQLAAYYRREGNLNKAEKVLSKFSSPSGFDRLPAKVAIPYLRCLLENAHIKALKKDLPGALQLLNWAESRKRDYERAFSCMKYSEILLDLNETERANAYLRNVKQILAKHINESATGGAIGQGSKALDTQGSWRTLRDQANHLALEIEEVQLSKKFGATYASYVKLRRLQRIVKRSKSPRYFNEAIKLCEEIEESDPESQFAAAAGYLKAQLLLKNPTLNPKKAIKEAKNQLNKFVKSNPEGLYRGEALMLLGKISLEKEWDAKDAEKYYSQALIWFKQAREKRDAMSLYAPMSNDLKTQTKATQKPTTLNKWRRTVYHKEDPLKLYNTATSPSWYVSDKEKNCYFILGFCKYLSEKYDEASELWDKAGKLDPQILALIADNTPNVILRLKAACKQKKMIFDEKQRKEFKGRDKIMLAYAELLFGMEKFKESKKLFESLAAEGKKKLLLASSIGMAYCSQMLGGSKEGKSRVKIGQQSWGKIYKLSKGTGFEEEALRRLAAFYAASTTTKKQALHYNEIYLKKFPKGKYRNGVMMSIAMCKLSQKDVKGMFKMYRKLKRNAPDSAQVKQFNRIFKLEGLDPKTEKFHDKTLNKKFNL